MSLDKIFGSKKTAAPSKLPSKPIRVATMCILLATAGVVLKSGYEFIGAVSDIQRTIAPSSNLPSEADGAFYFIEPASTTLS